MNIMLCRLFASVFDGEFLPFVIATLKMLFAFFVGRLWLQQNGLSGDISSQCDYAMEHLVGTGLFDYQADCLEIDCPCCTECCDNSGQCTLT